MVPMLNVIFVKITETPMLQKVLTFFIFIFLGLRISSSLQGQILQQDSSDNIFLINIGYGGYQPGGDLSTRFGYTNLAGGEIGYQFKSNFYFTGGMYFLFGGVVKEPNHLINLRYDGFTILNYNGQPAEIRVWERGYTVPLRVGWVLPRFDPFRANANSGPYIETGVQFIQHKIRIENVGNLVPSLSSQYLKGYDRLTNGIGVMQSVGYRYYSLNKLINFFVAVDIMENFTENRRDFQYDQEKVENKKRLDLMMGFRAGWTIPLYQINKSSIFYY
jgi:hypothetical protein